MFFECTFFEVSLKGRGSPYFDTKQYMRLRVKMLQDFADFSGLCVKPTEPDCTRILASLHALALCTGQLRSFRG